jgi:hypothetical protein
MSQGERWADEIMEPLSPTMNGNGLSTEAFNRIYEAVLRGTQPQGLSLVRAVLDAMSAAYLQGLDAGKKPAPRPQ